MTVAARGLAELQVAFAILTRLPVGRIREPVPTIADARWAFPLCGAAVGAIAWALCLAALSVGLPASVAALLAVAAGWLATGALHEDGLADLADGLGGGRDREAKLRIMRDSRIGSYGVLALILAVALKAACLVALGADGAGLSAFVAIAAGSRCCIVVALDRMPAARSDGLGAAAAGAGGWRLPIALGLTVLALAPLGLEAFIVAGAMAIAAAAPAVLARRQLGGQTGDVLGALQMTAETAGWIALTAIVSAAAAT